MLITNVRPWGGEPCDIEIRDGVIAALTAHAPDRQSPADSVAGRGGSPCRPSPTFTATSTRPVSACRSAPTRAAPVSGA